MPIEIKELHIAIKVRDDHAFGHNAPVGAARGLLKQQDVIEACTAAVLEVLKEREER